MAKLEDFAANEPRSITDGPFGSNLKTAHYTEHGPRVIRLQNIGYGRFIDEPAHISEEHYDKLKAHSADAGDVVVASLGNELPRACMVPSWLGPAVVKADCIRLRPAGDVDGRYVMYMLNAPQSRNTVKDMIHGVGRPRLGLQVIRSIEIPRAPLDEQQRIVEAIEEQFSRLDAGVESLHRAKRNLARLRVSILQAGVEGRLTASDTESWDMKPIGQVGRVGSGATPKRGNQQYWVGGAIPWVTSGQLNASLVTEPADYITEWALEETSVRLWPAGTILVAMYGEGKTRGKCAELAFPSTTNQACAAIVLNEEFEHIRPFLKLFLTARYEQTRRLASGGVQPNLSLGLIKSIEVPIPPATEQVRIVAEAERLLSVVESLDAVVELALKRSQPLRQSILSAAFGGRLASRTREVA